MSMNYTPLNVAKDEIRLLSFLPSDDNVLHFSLEHFPFISAPPFWAFSYTWGDSTKTIRIVVNGHDFEGTENLVFALRTHQELLLLRSEVEHPHFQAQHIWADAICINQNDYEERAQQVLRMRQIYQIGIVAIYLNSEHRDAHKTEYATLSKLGQKGNESLDVEIPPSNWPHLARFFSKPWFTRMWVIQEFVLSKSQSQHFFVGGHKALGDVTLRKAAWEIFQMDSIPITPRERILLFNGIKQYLSLAEVKDRMEDNKPCSLLTLLWTFRDRIASDPRDKIYSLLGVHDQFKNADNSSTMTMSEATGGLDMNELILDYEAEVEVVYASFVKAVVTRTHSLNILCACQAPGNFVRSWVPDWSEPWSRVSLLINSMGLISDKFDIEKHQASKDKRAVAQFSENMSHLTANGICWSRVLVLSSREVEGKTWAVEWLRTLDDNILQLLENTYEGCEYEAGVEWILAVCAGDFSPSEARAHDYYQFFPGASEEWHEMARDYKEGQVDEDGDDYGYINTRIAQMTGGRKIFVSESGHCGLVPDHTEIGDFVCVLLGCDVPVILRQAEDRYTFIRESYVRGLMQGQAIAASQRREVHLQDFKIY